MSHHIEYQRFRRGESCTEDGCRARKFYIEDGKKFCQRGHEQAGFTQTQQDEDDWNAQGKKSRKKREEKERVETVLGGNEARKLYLQCYQLILWKQCHWLINVKGFPKELETVVRDLWGLRVSLVHKSDERCGYGSGTGGYGSGTGTTMFSSMSEGESTGTDGTKAKSLASSKSRRSAVSEEKLPRLVETLGLCYMAMLLMRLPTSLGEVYKWATHEEIVFFRAIAEIPKDMRIKLPGHFHAALEMKSVPRGSTLHSTVLELVQFYAAQFEMLCPPLNAPVLLFKHIRDLGLPAEIYPAVNRLGKLLDIDYSWPTTHQKIYGVSSYPELQMMSLIVLATKLGHPFDDIDRSPESEIDPTVVRISWPKWISVMRERLPKGLKRGEEVKVTDTDVWNMNAKKMDDYLEWYQRTWIDDRDPKKLPPRGAEESDHTQKVNRLRAIQSSLLVQRPKPLRPGQDDNVNRPGELYKRYRTVEELPATAKAFHEMAASNAGISLRMLVKGVFQYEVKLENWIVAERKMEMAGISGDGLEEDEF